MCVSIGDVGDVWRAEEGAIGEAKSDKGEWKEGEATEMWGYAVRLCSEDRGGGSGEKICPGEDLIGGDVRDRNDPGTAS